MHAIDAAVGVPSPRARDGDHGGGGGGGGGPLYTHSTHGMTPLWPRTYMAVLVRAWPMAGATIATVAHKRPIHTQPVGATVEAARVLAIVCHAPRVAPAALPIRVGFAGREAGTTDMRIVIFVDFCRFCSGHGLSFIELQAHDRPLAKDTALPLRYSKFDGF